ncbi:MAG: LysM peptidoglycan-binding domain-containing protein [Chlamydiia bacterium]|nr:LysM peptidoglycan-binding domain-containing protein [Chlamydiia bacterium]
MRLNKSLPWWVLIFSCLFNLLFAAFFFYWMIRQRFDHLPFAPPQVAVIPLTQAKANVIKALWELDFEKLSSFLKDDRHVEDGYCIRDFALALMVHRHFFAIKRALSSPDRRITKIKLNKSEVMVLFDKLSDEAFFQMEQFLAKERAPYTTQGLFIKMQEDSSYATPFMQSEEFLAVYTLFRRENPGITPHEVCEFFKERDWEAFKKGYDFLAETGDFSQEAYGEIVKEFQMKRTGIDQLRLSREKEHRTNSPSKIHVIGEGETLWMIARRYKVSLDDLIRKNHLQSTVIRPGQSLKIPSYKSVIWEESRDHPDAKAHTS